MARRSILSSVREQKTLQADNIPAAVPVTVAPTPIEPAPVAVPASKAARPPRMHVGGYYNPDDPVIIGFQKLAIDLRRSKQDMLLEAITDFVAKSHASRAFNQQKEVV